jgi:hypothetical protein
MRFIGGDLIGVVSSTGPASLISLTEDAILTGNGTSPIQAESTLTYTSDTLSIGGDDADGATIKRQDHGDGGAGTLNIKGANGTGTDQTGGALKIYGGQGTGTGDGGDIQLWTAAGGSSGSSLNGFGFLPRFKIDANGDTTISGNLNILGTVYSTGDATVFGNDIVFEGTTDDIYEVTLSGGDPTSDITVTLPASTGTLALQNEDTTGNAATADAATLAAGVVTIGNLTGDVTSSNRATTLAAAQTNITSLGTLTSLDVDNININGDTITASGDLDIVATGNDVRVDTDNFIITSDTSIKPRVTLKSTVSSNKPSVLEFVKDKGVAGADGDYIGDIYYTSDNDAQEQIDFVLIQGIVSDATDGAEEGRYDVHIKNTTSATPVGSFILEGNGANTDAKIGYGTGSVTTITGTLTMGSTAAMTNTGLLSVANQSNITGVGTISSGTWQGTTIKTAYIGDDQVTEDKLANTLLAEIDANTAKPDLTLDGAGTVHANNYTSYTDASAVSAVSAADDYLKNDASDTITGDLTIASNYLYLKDQSGSLAAARLTTDTLTTNRTLALPDNDGTLATTNKVIDTKVAAYHSSYLNTGYYITLSGASTSESTSLSASSYTSIFVVPYDGKVLRISSHSQSSTSKSSTLEMYIDGDDSDLVNDQRGTDIATGTYTKKFTVDCPSDWTFSKGETIAIRRTDTDEVYGTSMTVVLEYDTTT